MSLALYPITLLNAPSLFSALASWSSPVPNFVLASSNAWRSSGVHFPNLPGAVLEALQRLDLALDPGAVPGLGAQEPEQDVVPRGPVARLRVAAGDAVEDLLQFAGRLVAGVDRVVHGLVVKRLVGGPPAFRGGVGQAFLGRLSVGTDRHAVRGGLVRRRLQRALDLREVDRQPVHDVPGARDQRVQRGTALRVPVPGPAERR
jgi:hypothetical protein